jgi:signal transduction histidine kinase
MMKNQSAVVVASLMIIVLSFMFYLFSNVLNFFIIGIGMGLFIIITAMFFLLSEIRNSIVEMSDAVEMNNVMIEASGRSVILHSRDPRAEPDKNIPEDEPSGSGTKDSET